MHIYYLPTYRQRSIFTIQIYRLGNRYLLKIFQQFGLGTFFNLVCYSINLYKVIFSWGFSCYHMLNGKHVPLNRLFIKNKKVPSDYRSLTTIVYNTIIVKGNKVLSYILSLILNILETILSSILDIFFKQLKKLNLLSMCCT